jgi:hypothetical protein
MPRYTIKFVNGIIVIRDELTKNHMETFLTLRAAHTAFARRNLAEFTL